ncbi:hypothetical protein AVEN_5858-1 [Araneus ventricosus]|uniref:Uncharacterized protein n=1 Tax=Araneus ventricosus TaxID=182803 RepID=A0A4Y2KX96_ARAVE|nr:hypothetical protein AVEN_5858-1 [Araneus ventricosus]
MTSMSPSAAAILAAGSADISSLSPISPLLSEIPFYCPPLPEMPFVSKIFCLSIGYFLSDSEALALPKCRTFIYAMGPTTRKRVLLTLEQKFQIDCSCLQPFLDIRSHVACGFTGNSWTFSVKISKLHCEKPAWILGFRSMSY